MNLRDQLRGILPEILSANPAESIKGTELIRLVKYRLHQDYSDATLRYHFSIMSCDPSSPIAKVEQGQGYYLRTTTIHSFNSARNLIAQRQGSFGESFAVTSHEVDLALARADKFRTIFTRHFELNRRFPFCFEESFSENDRHQNLWRFPDAVLLEWHVAASSGDGLAIDPSLLDLCRGSGSPPFTLTSVKLKLDVTHETFREDFFQCLSNSLWAHTGDLVVAAPLTDEKLLQDLRALGNRFKVGITSFGLPVEVLDDLPEAAAIRSLGNREFEAIQSRFSLQRVAPAAPRHSLSWSEITELREKNSEFEALFAWISRCLSEGRAHSYRAPRPPAPPLRQEVRAAASADHIALTAE